ncbi:hypothetical protein D0Z03_000755 [Geotrichum reessii]|nr:hypothetical protein D0Z03_000755 [Galactomyces reessii]
MKQSSTLLATALTASVGLVSAGGADSSCTNIIGNYYCNEVSQVQYTNIGFQGSYNEVISFNTDSCTCDSKPVKFSGSLAPFDQELSVHFRGPLQLKQFAQYSFSDNTNRKRHLHHVHKREDPEMVEYVYVTQDVSITTTVFGNDASAKPTSTSALFNTPESVQTKPQESSVLLANTPNKQQESAAASSAIQSIASSGNSGSTVKNDGSSKNIVISSSSSVGASSEPAKTVSTVAPKKSSVSGTGWSRDAYYNADSSTSSGLVFLNNLGGVNGSGIWDACFGNSLSFCGSDGVSASNEPTTLSNVFLPSNKEFTIFSGRECNGDSCGFYRPGTPAYHGFGGVKKIFMFEFKMPMDSGSNEQINADMPAIWLLNAQIPRTLQYGNGKCSCWSSGCGEFDIFEVLNSGNKWLTSHLHSGQGSRDPSGSYGGGGTPDYIMRPIDKYMKAAVVFDENTITITVLKDDVSFDNFITQDIISGWIKEQDDVATVFKLADGN